MMTLSHEPDIARPSWDQFHLIENRGAQLGLGFQRLESNRCIRGGDED